MELLLSKFSTDLAESIIDRLYLRQNKPASCITGQHQYLNQLISSYV